MCISSESRFLRFCGPFLNTLMTFNFRCETCFEERIKLSTKSMSCDVFLSTGKHSTKGRENAYFFDLHFWIFDIFENFEKIQKFSFWQTFPLEMPFSAENPKKNRHENPKKNWKILKTFLKNFTNIFPPKNRKCAFDQNRDFCVFVTTFWAT